MRIQVESDVADEYKAGRLAPLMKELVHSIRNDGTVKLSSRCVNCSEDGKHIRIDEKLYAPDKCLIEPF